MDDGVAYMVMGEGDMSQATQMVAIDNGDGTQQFAIPVMDPETGQETYMIIDPQTAQVWLNDFEGLFCRTEHFCSAWSRLQLNTKIGLNHPLTTHHKLLGQF